MLLGEKHGFHFARDAQGTIVPVQDLTPQQLSVAIRNREAAAKVGCGISSYTIPLFVQLPSGEGQGAKRNRNGKMIFELPSVIGQPPCTLAEPTQSSEIQFLRQQRGLLRQSLAVRPAPCQAHETISHASPSGEPKPAEQGEVCSNEPAAVAVHDVTAKLIGNTAPPECAVLANEVPHIPASGPHFNRRRRSPRAAAKLRTPVAKTTSRGRLSLSQKYFVPRSAIEMHTPKKVGDVQ
jgi:hypothetical protein